MTPIGGTGAGAMYGIGGGPGAGRGGGDGGGGGGTMQDDNPRTRAAAKAAAAIGDFIGFLPSFSRQPERTTRPARIIRRWNAGIKASTSLSPRLDPPASLMASALETG